MNPSVATWLFQTNAIRVCPENKPFWYTSGRIGPFYVNTHFLYGSEAKATALLGEIDALLQEPALLSGAVEALVLKNLQEDAIFAGVIDALVEKVSGTLKLSEVDLVSGGERRDWFFSLALAHRLGKPHLTLFKDMSAHLYLGANQPARDNLPQPGTSVPVNTLSGMRCLHVADLITTASSYERAWVPAIRDLGGEMPWSLVVVDRLQGGGALLARLGVQSLALVAVDPDLFKAAVDAGVLPKSVLPMLLDYLADPEAAMGRFVVAHPEFMTEALASDEKTAARARLCLEKQFYPANGGRSVGNGQ
jgi:orotate phosphoribosyltransferase